MNVSIGGIIKDYTKRILGKAGEDDIFFLASAVSFSILLAVVPFFLFYATSITYLLNLSTSAATIEVAAILDRFMPPRSDGTESAVTTIVTDIIRSRGKVGLYSAIGFIWFSTRLFGTLRSALSKIFDIDQDRGIVRGKLFDVKVTVFSAFIMIAYTTLSAYLVIATSHGVSVMQTMGLRDDVMSGLDYTLGRIVAFFFVVIMFFGLYKYVPFTKVNWKSAIVASIFAGVGFELARTGFGYYVTSFKPGSIYTGTVATLVVAVLWIYYAAIVMVLGAEVAYVHGLRRTRQLQREAFED